MLKRIYSCLKIIYKYSPIAAFLYLVFSIIMAVLPAIILIITERLINSIAIGSAHIKTEIFLWILLLFLSLLFMAILTFINGIQKIKINKTLSIKFSLFFYKQITALEYSNFENADSQNTFSRLGNSLYERIVDMYEIFCATFSALLGFVAYAALFVQVSLWTLILFPIVAISIYIIDSKNLKIMKQLQDRQSLDERFASYLEKICLNKHALFELKVFGAAKYIIQLFSSKSKKLHKELYNEYTYLQRNLFIGALISILWIALIIYHLSDAIIKAEVSIGLFATLIGGAYSLVSSIQSFSYLSSVLTQESVVMVHYQNFFSF